MSIILTSLRFWICQLPIFFLASFCWSELATETVYLTWQKSPTTTMTIQWLTSPQEKQTKLVYRLKDNPTSWLEIEGESFKLPQSTQYLVHRVELQRLQSDSEYLFKINPYQNEFLFRTLPAHLDQGLRFVVGGDMYHDGMDLVCKTCKQAAETSPAFALIGGDIAYAVGSAHLPFQKIDRWFDWIKNWRATMITPQGYLIPVIAALGNHDLIGHFDQTPAQAAVFSALFPMPGKRIYNVLDFNNYLSLFIMDSGHANPIDGKQTKWLKESLQARQDNMHRLAIYHVPAYPSIRDFYNRHSRAIRRHWIPLFESGGIQTVFEHHDHAYKRTHPLLNNRVHTKGIVYIGDGAWGVDNIRTPRAKEHRPYLAKFFPKRHFILVTLNNEQQRYKVITDQGSVIDEYTKQLDAPLQKVGQEKKTEEQLLKV